MQSRSDGLKGLNRRFAEVEAHACLCKTDHVVSGDVCELCGVAREVQWQLDEAEGSHMSSRSTPDLRWPAIKLTSSAPGKVKRRRRLELRCRQASGS
jgi:hypothetical protein